MGFNKDNFFKITFPFISKNYNADSEIKKKYRGDIYLIFDIFEDRPRIVFDTLQFADEEIIEVCNSKNYEFAKSYMTGKGASELRDLRKEAFPDSDYIPNQGGKKELSRLRISVRKVNEKILEVGSTIKTAISFISGSNAGGGLSKPSSDEIRIYYKGNDPIFNYYKKHLKETKENIEWMIGSLLSTNNLHLSSSNNSFFKGLKIDDILSIREITFREFMDLKLEVIPWGKTLFKEDYVPMIEAIASQNRNLFTNQYEFGNPLLFDKTYVEVDAIEKIRILVEEGNKKAVSKELRYTWRNIVNKDIDKHKYNKDFVKGISRMQRCHIIENHEALNMLMDLRIDWEEKEEYLKLLFNPNNYLLLEPTIHNYWDVTRKIAIETNGEIINLGLPEHEFNSIVSDHPSILNIYGDDVLTRERIRLLEIRTE